MKLSVLPFGRPSSQRLHDTYVADVECSACVGFSRDVEETELQDVANLGTCVNTTCARITHSNRYSNQFHSNLNI